MHQHAARLKVPISVAALGLCLAMPPLALRAQSVPSPSPSPVAERWSVHAVATDIQQYHGAFPAAYSGPNSLQPTADTAKTATGTLSLGARLGPQTELYVDPELDQGFGLGHPGPAGSIYQGSIGAFGFFSGGAYKIGSDTSYGRIQRAFVRQTIDLGGERSAVEPDFNQLGGSMTANHLALTAGKFSVVDIFDTNPYAHDPTNDFLNWTIIDMGSFDYAADAWGFTYGVAAELVHAASAVRIGAFQLSRVPNTIPIEPQPFRQWSPIIEVERDTSFFGGHPGAMKLLVYGDDGYMGSYADALAAVAGTGAPPNTLNVEFARHWKIGAGLNVAQEIAPHVGAFLRLSAMNGTWEAFEFTDADTSVSGGFSLDGAMWHRPHDTFGIAGVRNGASVPLQQYLAAGGAGILAGDGGLAYAPEYVLETYYRLGVGQGFAISGDLQRVWNPAGNSARGPISVFGMRLHAKL